MTAPRPSSGVRSGAVLAGASAVSIVANYVFLLAAGRVLGSADYGSLAALLGLLAVVLIPAGALQMAVSREISREIASGNAPAARTLGYATLRLSALATVPLLAVAFALTVPLADVLHIDSTAAVLITLATLATALVFPTAIGVLQGAQRFHAVAALYVVPLVVRLVAFGIIAAAGYRLVGATAATFIGAVAGTVVALWFARSLVQSEGVAPDIRAFLRYLAPVAVGLVGIALLTHVDILIVKARFSADDAGAYGAASAFARVAFFLPTTILAVLFPRTAARQARGEETEDILGRSLLATGAFCGLLALVYAAIGVGLVVATFGPDFATGGEILAPFSLAIGLYSLANVLVAYHLSRGELRYAWIVAAGVVVQVVVLAVAPSSLHGVVWANVAVGAALLVAHELFVGSSARALRAGLRYLSKPARRVRELLPETLLVVGGTTLFVCLLFWPVVEHLGSTIIGSPGSDSTASVAWLWTLRHESGFHILGTSHHTLSGAPFGWDETNARNLQLTLAYYPTYLAAHIVGDVAAYNLVTLAGFALSGAAMYLLVRVLGCGRLVAAWAALAIIVFPYHFAHEEHGSLLHVEVFVLLILALVAFALRPSWLRLGVVAAANVACWLMSGYFGPMAAVATVAFAIGAALVSHARRALIVSGAAIAAVGAAGVLGIAAVASGTNSGAGLERSAGDLALFGIRPLDLIVPPTGNIVLGDRLSSFWLRHSHGSNQTEIIVYVGLLTIALALAWLVIAWRRRKALSPTLRVATAGLVAAFAAGLLFAAPSPIHIGAHAVWMPSRLLFELAPAFRVLSRWDAFLMTALVPLAALGLNVAYGAIRRRPRGHVLAPTSVVVAMVVSFGELTLHPAKPRWRTVPTPAEYAAVKKETRPGIFAEYPLGYSDLYRIRQLDHGRPLLNGAPPDSTADYGRLMLLDPAQAGTAQALALLGVSAIAIHPGAHVDAEVPPTDPTSDKGYALVGRFPDGSSVWSVVAPPAAAFATLLPGGFGKPSRVGTSVLYPLIASVAALDLQAKEAGVVKLSFDAVPPEGKTVKLRLGGEVSEQAFDLNGRARVSLLVDVPRGHSRLLVKVDPAPTSEADAVRLSAPLAERASGTAGVRPQLVGADPGF